MSLTNSEMVQLRRIVAAAEKILARAETVKKAPAKGKRPSAAKVAKSGQTKRSRRTGKELLAFRRMLKAE